MSSLLGGGGGGAAAHRRPARPGRGNGHTHSYTSLRPCFLALAKLAAIPLASAAPLLQRGLHALEEKELPKAPDDPELWINLSIAVALVLLGGAFAGLTIALMGQDETYLQVIASSGEGKERKHAEKVLNLLSKGKHWVLVTLLLSNVITNETLPIVLDRSLGGGWPAVVSSTVLIVIFGEVAPQSVCVRYGLSIGAAMSPFVLFLMWIMAPIAWPTAKLLDYLLGEEHGTMYNKPGLKTLVTLHKTLGTAPGDGLMEDEVTIINSVLDLKDKPVGDIMTPMQDVFIMSADTVLDEKMMDIILSQGYSRIPIYAPDNRRNFIGMLLVKILITYDPEDAKRVRDFALATLPETGPYTSCLDIINFFQEGKSHMVLVSDFPGDDKGALGVVTLEDVIEELIGEEIIDESDVFVDVHKAIRRMAPAPRTRYGKISAIESDVEGPDAGEDTPLLGKDEVPSRKPSLVDGQRTTFLMRRKSSNASDSTRDNSRPAQVRGNAQDLRRHLSHLGPSNMASKPKPTKYTSVKIKPGVGTIPEGQATTTGVGENASRSPRPSISETQPPAPLEGGEGAGLLKDAGKDAADGVAAVHAGYGTLRPSSRASSRRAPLDEEEITVDNTNNNNNNTTTTTDPDKMTAAEASRLAELKTSSSPPRDTWQGSEHGGSNTAQENGSIVIKGEDNDDEPQSPRSKASPSKDKTRLDPDSARKQKSDKLVIGPPHNNGDVDEKDDDEVGDMPPSRDRSKSRRTARSGSITESTVEINGYKKTVLETTSSSDDETGSSPKKGTPPKGSWLSQTPEPASSGGAEADKANGSGTNSAAPSVSGASAGGGGGASGSGGKPKKKKPKKKGKNKNDF